MSDEEALSQAVKTTSTDKPLAEPIHQQFFGRLKIFLICGGMPEAVSQYVRKHDLLNGGLVLNDLLTVLKTDFTKYRKRTPLLLLTSTTILLAEIDQPRFLRWQCTG